MCRPRWGSLGFRDEVDAFGVENHRGDDRPDSRDLGTGAQSKDRGAIDVRPLMSCPSGQLVGVFVDPVDQNLHTFADPFLGTLDVELLHQRREIRDTLVDDMPVQLACKGLGLGPVLVGVAENPDHVQTGGCQESLELVKVLLRLSWEPHDDVGADAGQRGARTDLTDQVEEGLGRAEPPHLAQELL